MQREEKNLDATTEALLNRLNDLKDGIGNLLFKVETEYETISWPQFLDNFGLISSHLTALRKILSKELCHPLRNRTVLPLLTSTEPDETLIALTEGRIPVFAKDIVPDYLRTKPDPVSEQKMLQNEQKAASVSAEAAMKQITQFNKVTSHILDMVSKAREEWEMESSARTNIQQSSSLADTHALITAIGVGKGLKISMPMNVPPGGPSGMMVPPVIRGATPMNPGNQGGPMGKAPSAIKTNIKSAMQVHPFSRN